MSPRNLHIVVLSRAVAPLHGVGGLERHAYDLIRHLLKRNVKVTLITRRPGAAMPPASEVFGHDKLTVRFVPYLTLPFAGRRGTTIVDRSSAYLLWGWRAGRLAAELVARGDIQIVHGMGAASLGYAEARTRDWYGTVPFVLNPHGMEEFGSTGPGLGALKHLAYAPLREAVCACARAADRIISTDRSLVPTVLRHLKVDERKVAVVPNAVDLEEVNRIRSNSAARQVRERLGLSAEDTLLLGVGRLEENKGFQHLVAALAQLAAGRSAHQGALGRRWRCVVLGEGSYRPRLEAAIASAGLQDFVVLPGSVSGDQLHAWYEAATLFVHPTLYEGSSIVTLEAMAHRRAIVATRAGGLPDKIRPGENGWLVAPGDTEALARALDEALARRDQLSAMGERGRGIVEREFAWDSIVGQLLALYDDVLRTSRAAR